MRHRSSRWVFLLFLIGMMSASPMAYGQGGTTSTLSGVVTDTSGGVIPGADIVAKHNATGTLTQAVSDSEGRFTIPALRPGMYTVTVSLMGFKTALLTEIELVTAVPSSVKATLQVGELQETVVVTGAAEIVQTQTTTISTTLTAKQVSNLPLSTRNAMDFLTYLPGVDTYTSTRNAVVMGLTSGAVNITIDGVNVQDNYLKSDSGNGMFAYINPRLDSIEEVTVSTANPGAESSGAGAVQIRYATRSGTNKFQGSVYHYLRRQEFNSNYWFNKRDGLPRDNVKVDTFGGRLGGPIVIPGLFDGHDKAFFFMNYEEFRQPAQTSRQRTIMSPSSQAGIFQYNTGSGVQSVNLLTLAAAKGVTSSMDPVVAKLLADIRNSTTKVGTVSSLTDPSIERFSFQNFGKALRRYPTGRLDVNLSSKHRLSGSYTVHTYSTAPDILNSDDSIFPGFPAAASQTSTRQMFNTSLRSTLTGTMVNELRGGFTMGTTHFRSEITPAIFSGDLANQAGFGLIINGFNGINNAYNSRNPSDRGAPTYFVEETMSWLKGAHSISMGGTFTQNNMDLASGNVVPSVTFGVDTNDPAYGMFTTANFPGASSTNLTNARNLYAVLTGSVTAITGSGVLDGGTGKYVYMGKAKQLARQRTVGLFLSDQWKLRPTLTVNYGVRYELQLPFTPLNDYYSKVADPAMLYGVSGAGNMFKPGTLTGQAPQFVQFAKGEGAYKTDYNNVAPSVGLAWRISPKSPWLQKLLSTDAVVRAGYSLSYVREGMNAVDSLFNANPGGTITATRSMALGNLVPTSTQLPVLLRQKDRLGAPAYPEQPNYPLSNGNGFGYSDSLNLFDPNLKVPYVHSFSAGFQRSLSKNTAFELRYTGNRNRGGFVIGGRNYNEVNIRENGFLNEFKLAQGNLQANLAAGRGATYKYFGAGTGTNPLPILLAYANGVPQAQATDPSKYTSTLFNNSTYVNYLAQQNPNPRSMASGLFGDAARRTNAIGAGLPSNFFVVNPDNGGGGTWMTTNERWTNYDAIQVELRRRLSAGFQILGGYTYARGEWGEFYTLRTGAESIPRANTPRHAYKVSWVYELPFGQGKRFGGGVGSGLNRLIGGWEFDGAGRVLSGQFMDFGNVRMVGMTADDVQKMYDFRIEPGTQKVYMLPQDVIDNTIKAFSVDATSPTGYSSLGVPTGKYFAPASGPSCVQDIAGDCAPRHNWVNAPYFVRFDVTLAKRVPIKGRMNAEIRAEVLNVFDTINFTPNAYVGSAPASYEVTTAYRDSSNTQDPGGRIMQLSWRLSW